LQLSPKGLFFHAGREHSNELRLKVLQWGRGAWVTQRTVRNMPYQAAVNHRTIMNPLCAFEDSCIVLYNTARAQRTEADGIK